jgi:hypothetical protein
VTQNGRLSQNIDDCLEARAKGRGLFRSLNPSAMNFPLQVQWIDSRHQTHRSFKTPISSAARSTISSAPTTRRLVNREPNVGVPKFYDPATGFPTSRARHFRCADLLRCQATPGLQYGSGGLAPVLSKRRTPQVAQHAGISQARLYKREQRRNHANLERCASTSRPEQAAAHGGTSVQSCRTTFNKEL